MQCTLLWNRNTSTCLLYPANSTDALQIAGNVYVQGSILPTTATSNLGDVNHRFGNIYINATINYMSALCFVSGSTTNFTMTCDGKFGIKKTPTQEIDVLGSGNFDCNLTIAGNLNVGCVINGPVVKIKSGTQTQRDAFFATLIGGESWYNIDTNQFEIYKPGSGWAIIG